jgi:hypothetical protein
MPTRAGEKVVVVWAAVGCVICERLVIEVPKG